jgi:hypothetical protein
MSPETGVGEDDRDGDETGGGGAWVEVESLEGGSCPTWLGITDALEAVEVVPSMPSGDSTCIWVSESGETIIGGGFASNEGAASPSSGLAA